MTYLQLGAPTRHAGAQVRIPNARNAEGLLAMLFAHSLVPWRDQKVRGITWMRTLRVSSCAWATATHRLPLLQQVRIASAFGKTDVDVVGVVRAVRNRTLALLI